MAESERLVLKAEAQPKLLEPNILEFRFTLPNGVTESIEKEVPRQCLVGYFQIAAAGVCIKFNRDRQPTYYIENISVWCCSNCQGTQREVYNSCSVEAKGEAFFK